MKINNNNKNIIFLLSIILTIFQSCSLDNTSNSIISNQNVLIKKIIRSDGFSETFFYDGNKLKNILYNDGGSMVFIYFGDYIVRKELRNASNMFYGEYETYSYSNNRMSQLNGYNNNIKIYSYDYSYNSDGTIITITDKSYNSNGNISGSYIRKNYIDLNGSLVKTETLNSRNIVDQTEIFSYDNKNSIYKNILGVNFMLGALNGKFNLLSHNSPLINVNYSYKYNNQNYPISSSEITKINNGFKTLNYEYIYY